MRALFHSGLLQLASKRSDFAVNLRLRHSTTELKKRKVSDKSLERGVERSMTLCRRSADFSSLLKSLGAINLNLVIFSTKSHPKFPNTFVVVLTTGVRSARMAAEGN